MTVSPSIGETLDGKGTKKKAKKSTQKKIKKEKVQSVLSVRPVL